MTASGLAVAHRITVLAASLLALGAVVLFAAASPAGGDDGRLLVADLRGRALIVVDLTRAAAPLRVNRQAMFPYRPLLTSRMAASMSSTCKRLRTGPKISSCAMRAFGSMSAMIVGGMK